MSARLECKKWSVVDGWVGGWMGGWMDGSKSRVKDCLQQSKNECDFHHNLLQKGKNGSFFVPGGLGMTQMITLKCLEAKQVTSECPGGLLKCFESL